MMDTFFAIYVALGSLGGVLYLIHVARWAWNKSDATRFNADDTP